MGEPIRINYSSLAEVGSPAELAALTSDGRHLVLQFRSLAGAEGAALIGSLSAALPDHSVFVSGGGPECPRITVMPVVARSRVLERLDQVFLAIKQYLRSCTMLIEEYQSGVLAPEWQADEHGEHCRFKNRRTGQVVEAPLEECADHDRVDPYFFALFVHSTPGLEAVSELLTEDYHDAARVLDVVADARGT